MSEKNGEIAVTLRPDATIEQRVGDVLGGYTILLNGTTLERKANECGELRKLHDDYKAEIIYRVGHHFKHLLDQKDRDHEAEMTSLRAKIASLRSEKESIRLTAVNNKEWAEKHEALIGVLVGVISKIESDLDDAINGRDPVSDRAMWNEAKEALSHPLVQEYLKKEKV